MGDAVLLQFGCRCKTRSDGEPALQRCWCMSVTSDQTAVSAGIAWLLQRGSDLAALTRRSSLKVRKIVTGAQALAERGSGATQRDVAS